MSLLRLSKAAGDVVVCTGTRVFSKSVRNSSKNYIDEWYRSIVKPTEFYEDNAAPGLVRKKYFYTIDLQGRVFLEETLPKNIATSIKSVAFLDFLFRRIRRIEKREQDILRGLDAEEDYPFVSPCGLELNFVRPADLPIVFHTMDDTEDGDKVLVFGGSMVQSFCPDKIALAKDTGRLYHELINPCRDCAEDSSTPVQTKRAGLTPIHASDMVEYGLLRSSVAVTLSDFICVGSDEENDVYSGMDFCADSGSRYPIKWLPIGAQSGAWSMPFMEGSE